MEEDTSGWALPFGQHQDGIVEQCRHSLMLGIVEEMLPTGIIGDCSPLVEGVFATEKAKAEQGEEQGIHRNRRHKADKTKRVIRLKRRCSLSPRGE